MSIRDGQTTTGCERKIDVYGLGIELDVERKRNILTGTRSTGVGRVGGGGWERGVGSRL